MKDLSEKQKEELAAEYERVLEFCSDESGEYSFRHYRKMSSILGTRPTASNRIKRIKNRITAAIVAAATLLLLAGCTAAIYKEQIGDFFTSVYETYIKGNFADKDTDNNGSIEEYYTLTYVPEGYELVDKVLTPIIVNYRWKNSENNIIVFEQLILDTTQFTLDAENGYTSVIENNDLIIYCRTIDNYKYYIWRDNNYSYSLKACIQVDNEEMKKILDGITLKTE